MGSLLRKKLIKNNWAIKNNSPFPVICFTDDSFKNEANFKGNYVSSIKIKLVLFPNGGSTTQWGFHYAIEVQWSNSGPYFIKFELIVKNFFHVSDISFHLIF